MGSSPNFRGASALLRGSSRAFSPDCEPQRAFRGQPPQAALRPRSRIRRDDPAGCLTGEGSKAASVWPQPKRIGAGRLPRVFSAGAEARHPPRRPCGLPHGRGVSDPSPCAPPRQAGRLGPIGHSVEGFCGSIRLAPDQTDRRLRLPRVFSASAEARQAASPNGLSFLPFIRFYHESGCQSEPGGNFPPGFDISVRIGKSNSISKNGWLYTKRSLEKFQ